MAVQLELFENISGEELIEFRIKKMEDRIEKARKGLFLRYGELDTMLQELKKEIEIRKKSNDLASSIFNRHAYLYCSNNINFN